MPLWPGRPTKPAGPLCPGEPLGPTLPGGPSGPVLPVSPLLPGLPIMPDGPLSPGKPLAPLWLSLPIIPGGPCIPAAPSLPGSPFFPGAPGTPWTRVIQPFLSLLLVQTDQEVRELLEIRLYQDLHVTQWVLVLQVVPQVPGLPSVPCLLGFPLVRVVQGLPGYLALRSSHLGHFLLTFLEVPWNLADPFSRVILSDLASQDYQAFQYFQGFPSVRVFPYGLGLQSFPSDLAVHQVRAFLVLQQVLALRLVQEDQSDLAVLSVLSLL